MFRSSLVFLASLVLAAAAIGATSTTVKAAAASPPQVTVVWTAPTGNTDGTPISTPISYNLYQGLTGALAKVATAISGTTATVMSGLTQGTNQCFAVTAVVNGIESAQSNVACGLIPFSTPNAPGQTTIVITG
jgi:hypothetical protein